MALQNRVDPYGRLHAVTERGAWMGNRGVLHNAAREIVAACCSQRWITCALEFKGRRREVFAPHRYSELFFLDEATSLAAGHRPCAECRRSRFKEFRAAWAAGRSDRADSRPPTAEEMDRVLHAQRLLPGGGKRTYRGVLSSLPAGVIVEHEGRPHLISAGNLRPWSFAGYGPVASVPPTALVTVLTPRSIVHAIGAGFTPQVQGE